MKRLVMIFSFLLVPAFVWPQEGYRAGDHELLVSPTAFTLPKGKSYFTDYELFFLNYTYAPTSRTHISAFIMFPITTEFYQFFSLGIKQNYLRTSVISGAVWFSHNFKGKIASFGNAITLGSPANNLTINIGALTDYEEFEGLVSVGGIVSMTMNVKFLFEYMNTQSLIEDADFSGLIGLGFRFQGKRISFDVAGLRPLQGDLEDLIALPYLKATIVF